LEKSASLTYFTGFLNDFQRMEIKGRFRKGGVLTDFRPYKKEIWARFF